MNKISTTRHQQQEIKTMTRHQQKTSTRYQQQDNQRKSKKDQCSYRIQRKIKERSKKDEQDINDKTSMMRDQDNNKTLRSRQ